MLEDLEVAEAEVVVDSEEIAEEAVTADLGVTAVEVAIADLEAIVAADSAVIAVETVVVSAVKEVALEVVPCAVDEEAVVIVTDLIKVRTSSSYQCMIAPMKKEAQLYVNVNSEDSASPIKSQEDFKISFLHA